MANPEDYTEIPSVLCQSQWNQPFGKNVVFSRLFTLSDSLVNLSMRSTVYNISAYFWLILEGLTPCLKLKNILFFNKK